MKLLVKRTFAWLCYAVWMRLPTSVAFHPWVQSAMLPWVGYHAHEAWRLEGLPPLESTDFLEGLEL